MPINQFASSIFPVIGDALNIGMSLYRTKKTQDKYVQEEQEAANEVKVLKANRQAIIDPSTALEDLSGTFSNPYANLGVATKAAEMQMEQTDAALANTLDTLRATGSGAGGATALAQAALQSKNAVAAEHTTTRGSKSKTKGAGSGTTTDTNSGRKDKDTAG
jgi:cytoskeletal protein RodZ